MLSSVFYKSDCGNTLSCGVKNSNKDLHKVISSLYQIDVYQPLAKVQQQVLEMIAVELNIDAILWHAEMKSHIIDVDALLQQYEISDKNIESFDVRLDDSNVHHYLFIAFSDALSTSDVKHQVVYLSALLYLIAEIYRQTLIHSYYQEWKSLPFKKHRQLLGQTENSGDDISISAIDDESLSEAWKEREEANQHVLLRVKRIENQLFIDRFIIPRAIQSLTFKQKQICFFLKACCSNHQIAETLGVSIKTIGNHLTAIYEKLGISRSQLFQLLNTEDET